MRKIGEKSPCALEMYTEKCEYLFITRGREKKEGVFFTEERGFSRRGRCEIV